ncbi:hypothetical protein F4782DRAFT_506569 [Xylaria castorea]|nr:hypothetical protein F4782DRAFT_506569 [Xylaria castorea]
MRFTRIYILGNFSTNINLLIFFFSFLYILLFIVCCTRHTYEGKALVICDDRRPRRGERRAHYVAGRLQETPRLPRLKRLQGARLGRCVCRGALGGVLTRCRFQKAGFRNCVQGHALQPRLPPAREVDRIVLFCPIEAGSPRILIDDTEITKIDLHALRSYLSVILQDPILFLDTSSVDFRTI